MATPNLRRIEGTLTKDGRVWNIELEVITVGPGQGIEDEAVARVELLTKNIPNGEYTLDYFCFQHHHQHACVEDGVFLAPH
jgi:hypothetical protein